MRIKPLYLILGILLVIIMIGGCSYNGMNRSKLEVDSKWAAVQGAYQRRADLIPNLVSTVKGAADFEKSTYVQVAEARAGNLKSLTNVSADSLTPQRVAAIQKAGADVRNSISVIFERYPDLKATQNFSDLQSQLEGTENRINVERNNYNEAARDYNYKVTSFPSNLVSGIFGFRQRTMFEAEEGAQKAPKVSF